MTDTSKDAVRDQVREGYAEIARSGQWSGIVQPTVGDPLAVYCIQCGESPRAERTVIVEYNSGVKVMLQSHVVRD